MKTVLTISSVESGYTYGTSNGKGDAKYDFTRTISDAVETALAFQIGRVDPTPKDVCNQPQLQLARGDSGWAITKPMGIGAKVVDVLPATATAKQLAEALAVAMAYGAQEAGHDELLDEAVAARSVVN